MIFSKKQNFAIGLDINDDSLMAVQSKLLGDKIKIQALGRKSLERGVIIDEKITNPDIVVEKINNLFSKPLYGTFTSNEVVAKLPSSKTYVKYITIENSPNNITDMISNEIEKHIPLAKKDMYYDYQLIKNKKGYSHFLIGAAPKNIVDQYVSILKAAKLEVTALEINAICDARALIQEESNTEKSDKITALLNIGSNSSTLTIYAENTIVFSISMPISGRDVTDQISQTLEIKTEQAEKAKIVCGLDKSQANGIVYDVLTKMIDSLIKKVKISFEYLSTHFPEYSQIDEVILYGQAANIKDLEMVISKNLNTPTKISSPLIHFSANEDKIFENIKKKNSFQGQATTYTSAIGLSLRQVFLKQQQ